MIENVMFGILRIADTSRKIIVKRNRIVHSLAKEEAIYRSSTKKEKEKQKSPIKERLRLHLCIAKSPSQESFRKALAIRDFQERPVEKQRETLSTMPMKRILALRRKPPSEKGTQKIIPSEFEESNS